MNPSIAALGLVLTAFCSGCAGVDTEWFHDPNVDFTKLKKYDWMGIRGPPSPFVSKTVEEATDRHLAEKGLVLTSEDPDFQVVVWFAPEVETSVRLSGARTHRPGMWGGMPYSVDVQSFRGGTMMLDFVTVATTPEDRRLLWRGVAIGKTLSPRMTDDKRAELVQKTVAGLLSKYPPPPPPVLSDDH